MSLETYRLEVRETEIGEIDADVYDEDGLVEASAHVAYDEYGLDSTDSAEDISPVDESVTADVMSLDLQTERDDAGFTFKLIGDRSELASIRVEDDEWGFE